LEETAIAHLEDTAVKSNICALMEKAHLRPALIGLSLIRGDGDALRNSMKTLANEVDVLVCDAETDEDLSIVAEASMILERGTVWAGSAGLARFLPRAAGLTGSLVDLSRRRFATRPALFVVGSGSPTSREQAELLAAKSDTIDVRIPPEILLAGKQSLEWREHQTRIQGALNQGSDLVVLPGAGPQLDRSVGIKLAASLAEQVRPFAGAVGSLVVTGGETARAVFDAWGISRLHIVGEVEPGLPFSLTLGWSRDLPVLTKAGGFGSPETFLRCREFLSGLETGIAPGSGAEKTGS
jgi:4-hydroxythreonine-4-phosphate dehydrogenase